MVMLADVEGLYDRVVARLRDKRLSRADLLEITTVLEQLADDLTQIVNGYVGVYGGKEDTLLARGDIDGMQQSLRWMNRYGRFAEESDLRRHLLEALERAGNALNLLKQLDQEVTG